MVTARQAPIMPPSGATTTQGARTNRANARQRAQRAQTRERLIEGAITVFADLGYANAAIEHVLGRAEVSRASFYAHFSGKAALAQGIAERFAPIWQPLYRELATMHDPRADAVADWCARHVELYRQHQDICIILTQAAAIEPELYWQMARYREAIIDLLAASLPRMAHLASDPDARIRAALLLSQIDHTCYFLAIRRWAADPSAGVSAMADNVLRFLAEEGRAPEG